MPKKYATLREMKEACSKSPFFASEERKWFKDQKYHVFRNHLIIRGIFTGSNGISSSKISVFRYDPTSTDICPLNCVLSTRDFRSVEDVKEFIKNNS